MGKWIKITITALFLVLIGKVSGNDIFCPQDHPTGSQSVQATSRSTNGDYSSSKYVNWNVLEFASAQGEISTGRQSESGSRVRSSEAQTSLPYAQRASFLKGGKIQSLSQSLEFTFSTGLFPSGKYSFSQHLISLGKLRL